MQHNTSLAFTIISFSFFFYFSFDTLYSVHVSAHVSLQIVKSSFCVVFQEIKIYTPLMLFGQRSNLL